MREVLLNKHCFLLIAILVAYTGWAFGGRAMIIHPGALMKGSPVILIGENGEVVRFLKWVLGGENNTKQYVVGTDNTPESRKPDFQMETGRWYDLKVVICGRRSAFFVDGKLVNTVTGDLVLRGGFGFGTIGCQAEFKDVQVEASATSSVPARR